MRFIIDILGAVIFTYWFIEIARFPAKKIFRRQLLGRKPFNCQHCLPIYLTFAFWIMPQTIVNVVVCCITASLLSTFLFQILAKWNSN